MPAPPPAVNSYPVGYNQSNIQDDGVTPNKIQDDGEYTMGSLTLGTAVDNFLKLPFPAAPMDTPTSGVTYYDSNEERLKIYSTTDAGLNIAKGRDIDTVHL